MKLLKKIALVMVLANVGLTQQLDAAGLYNLMSPEEMKHFQWIKVRAISRGNAGAKFNNSPTGAANGPCQKEGVLLTDAVREGSGIWISTCRTDENQNKNEHWDIIWRRKNHPAGEGDHWRSFKDTNNENTFVRFNPTTKEPHLYYQDRVTPVPERK